MMSVIPTTQHRPVAYTLKAGVVECLNVLERKCFRVYEKWIIELTLINSISIIAKVKKKQSRPLIHFLIYDSFLLHMYLTLPDLSVILSL